MKYATSKTCSREIDFEVENNIVTSCEFVGGCMGNTQGVARLVVGRSVDDVNSIYSSLQRSRES